MSQPEKIVQIATDEFGTTTLTNKGRLFFLQPNGEWRELDLPKELQQPPLQ